MNPWQDFIDWFVDEVGGSAEEAGRAIAWVEEILIPDRQENKRLREENERLKHRLQEYMDSGAELLEECRDLRLKLEAKG